MKMGHNNKKEINIENKFNELSISGGNSGVMNAFPIL
jgi:hypothetical protein